MYVDNILDSVDTEEEAMDLYKQTAAVLSKSYFRLRKWASSSRQVIAEIPRNERANPELDLTKDVLVKEKTLGLLWDCEEDVLRFSWPTSSNHVPTKRQILSISARAFDPLGLISPVNITARIPLQELSITQCDWDDVPNENLISRWNVSLQDKEDLGSVSVPRLTRSSTRPYIFRIFCDAGEVAYGAVITATTFPRLELQGAVIAARMAATTVRDLQSSLERVTFWTDSGVVLLWLQATGRPFCTFAENRISEILDITKVNQWKYVPGKENAADILSRGLRLGTLKNSYWFSEPTFLWRTPESWPSNSLKTDVDVSAEELECVEAARFVSVYTSPSSEDVI
ncbi:hypothetical protein M514_27515 [Trichuris suis]|uniref:Pao retrotransposon peptidase n=1 Tax=Trichuris suis TaxID=68888 RepID=A0A085MSV0_9BILA|nr:hypothetical protein M514_27515 [Trichuris suis]